MANLPQEIFEGGGDQRQEQREDQHAAWGFWGPMADLGLWWPLGAPGPLLDGLIG